MFLPAIADDYHFDKIAMIKKKLGFYIQLRTGVSKEVN